ncbi:MAG: 30S ribosomal protein S8e [Candidatus Micrarchaeaceae archaeon]
MSQFGSQIHQRSNTKKLGNGKKVRKFRDKRRSEIGNYFAATKLSQSSAAARTRKRGGSLGIKLKHAAFANVLTKAGYKKAKITEVIESKDNKNFARQNIITKGTLINTELGKAVVLNRPGREGAINARLV